MTTEEALLMTIETMKEAAEKLLQTYDREPTQL